MALGADIVPHLDLFGEVSDSHNGAGQLMPECEGRVDPLLAPFVPLPDMDVGAADAGGFDLDEDVVVADFGYGDVLQHKPRFVLRLADSPHRFRHDSISFG